MVDLIMDLGILLMADLITDLLVVPVALVALVDLLVALVALVDLLVALVALVVVPVANQGMDLLTAVHPAHVSLMLYKEVQ